jgi:hypothetical protein
MTDNANSKGESRLRTFVSTIVRHAFFLTVALVLTLVVFEFWGRFGHAMGVVLGMNNTTSEQNNGEVTVTVLPPPKACPKDQKC